MDPQEQFCPNPACPARGLVGDGNIRVHSWPERRYRCTCCRKTFAATTGTIFYRRSTDPEVITRVLTLLVYGCPPQAIVAAFALDERTVTGWQAAAGAQCRRVHEHLVEAGRVDLGHVQADELRVKIVGGVVWLASALALPSRLWLGGAISAARDEALLRPLLRRVRAAAATLRLLVSSDGFRAYPKAIWHAFREPVRTGKRGRPCLAWPDGLLVGQVVKRREQARVVGIDRRVVRGSAAVIQATVATTRSGADLNTAFIERLNATFRARLVPLVRRGRAICRTVAQLDAAVWLLGTAYNFCWVHEGLRLPAAPGSERTWRERTPAMAAGLTHRAWSLGELLSYRVPPPPWVAPKRRGRPPKAATSPPALPVAA
jgi:transposase-like protein